MPNGELLRQIRTCVASGDYTLRWHALEQAEQREILLEEIEQALLAEDSEIVEDYPEDTRGSSCLILGWTKRRRPIHVQVSYPPDMTVITVYEPDQERWTDFRVRR